MPIPDYQTLMRPVLTLLADGQERAFHQLLPPLADQFHLTDEERDRLLPSGRQEMFRNRVHWACFYLLKAGLLERPPTWTRPNHVQRAGGAPPWRADQHHFPKTVS